jgi:hypothetical protein
MQKVLRKNWLEGKRLGKERGWIAMPNIGEVDMTVILVTGMANDF